MTMQAFRQALIVGWLREEREVVTAQQIADVYGVTTRTIHRDMKKIKAEFPQIKAEGGVGYMWRERK